MMVFEEIRIFGKNGTLGGRLHIALEFHHAVLTRIDEKVVQHLERGRIECLVILAGLKNAQHTRYQLFHNRERIGDEQRAGGGATDNNQFSRLEEHLQVPMLHQISTNDGSNDNSSSDDCK